MCLLPPNCLFCAHYHQEAGIDDADCAAFQEIPDRIFTGVVEHTEPVTGDGGIRFKLNPRMAEEFADIQQLRQQIENT
jgi:hypothetical protein